MTRKNISPATTMDETTATALSALAMASPMGLTTDKLLLPASILTDRIHDFAADAFFHQRPDRGPDLLGHLGKLFVGGHDIFHTRLLSLVDIVLVTLPRLFEGF